MLLLHEHHEELWKIVKRTLRAIVPEDAFARTEEKIERSFAAGYGTVLFFEDTNVVRDLQQKFPGYAGNFPVWSEQTSAMHQLAIWTMLEDAGFGASLQHYNPLIDNEVRKRWSLPEEWRLIAQMPFGTPAGEPGEKTFKPLDERIRVLQNLFSPLNNSLINNYLQTSRQTQMFNHPFNQCEKRGKTHSKKSS